MKQDIQVVIALNNRGAEELASGDHASASLSFSSAMKLLKSISNCGPNPQMCRIKARRDANRPWRLEAVPVLSPELLETDFAAFEHCFIAVPTKGRSIEDHTQEDRDLYAAALVYNLALVYHYSGVCLLCPDRLSESMGLYELASSLIQNLEESRDGLALFMAVSNNLACLSFALLQRKMFRKYRGCLKQLLKEKHDFHESFFSNNVLYTDGSYS